MLPQVPVHRTPNHEKQETAIDDIDQSIRDQNCIMYKSSSNEQLILVRNRQCKGF